MVRVSKVTEGSIAEELGIEAGTELLTVNGTAIGDFLDWEFLSADDDIVVGARDPDGNEVVLEIRNNEGEPLGITLEPPSVRRCANRCEFCFIEGLPKGLRRNLYIRDDDYRLSFTYGNFATLSNVKERDIARILAYRLSPLYVSVHATNWEARKVLLNNPRVPDIVDQLTRLAAGGIRFHCQMVVVPGLNDGAVLEESLTDLWKLGDAVITTAVVPVGLTQFSHLYSGQPMTAENARRLIDHVHHWSERARKERGTNWVFGSDELYLLAGVPLPDAQHYEDFAQIENGIGAVASLRQRLDRGLRSMTDLRGQKIGVVTGRAMSAIMPALLTKIAKKTRGEFELIIAENSLFGPTITTAGLLVGADVRRVLSCRDDLSFALIPAETINEDGVFLDDVRFDDLRRELPMPVYPSYDFVDALSDEGSRAAA